MKYKALHSFGGVVSATRGQIIEIKSKEIAKDLLEAGYLEPAEPVEAIPVKAAKATAKKAAEVKDIL